MLGFLYPACVVVLTVAVAILGGAEIAGAFFAQGLLVWVFGKLAVWGLTRERLSGFAVVAPGAAVVLAVLAGLSVLVRAFRDGYGLAPIVFGVVFSAIEVRRRRRDHRPPGGSGPGGDGFP